MKAILPLALFLVTAIPLHAFPPETSTETLEVYVKDDYTGEPVVFVLLSLWIGEVFVDSVRTDASGYAVFGGETTSIRGPGDGDLSMVPGYGFPNPFQARTSVLLQVNQPQRAEAMLFNAAGQIILRQTLWLEPGKSLLQLSLEGLPPGMYFLHIEGREKHTVVLQKMGPEQSGSRPVLQLSEGNSTRVFQSFNASGVEYTLKAELDPYDPVEMVLDPTQVSAVEMEMQRNNRVVFLVVDDQLHTLEYVMEVNLQDGWQEIISGDTLMLRSGVYEIVGESDTCFVDMHFEVPSTDLDLYIFREEITYPDFSTGLYVSTPELIVAALAGGEINYESSLLYRAYALYGDPRLPEAYRGNVRSLDDGTSLFREVRAKQEELSQETLDLLRPFMLRPNDTESYFYQVAKAGKQSGALPFDVDEWESKVTQNGRARVWVPAGDHSSRKLDNFTSEVNQIWPNLFGEEPLIRDPIPDVPGRPNNTVNPDNLIDLYVLPLGTLNPRTDSCMVGKVVVLCRFDNAAGWAMSDDPYQGRTSSGFILIDEALSGSHRTGTIAHELFHLGQFALDLEETHWLYESTAVWAEFTVLVRMGKSVQYIRDQLSQLYQDLDKQLDRNEPSKHAYNAYLFPLFIQMENANDPQTISGVWSLASTQANLSTKAYDMMFPFKDHFRKFALRNWNEDPVPRLYSSFDNGFPSDLQPPVKQTIQMPKDSEETLDESLAPLSMVYFRVEVELEDEDNLKLEFDLSGLTNDPDAGIDALVTIEGKEPEVQEWSKKEKVLFCLDDEDERVTEVILIISNASMDSELDYTIDIKRVDPCEYTLNYHTKIHWVLGDMYTWVFEYEAEVALEREEDKGEIKYLGQDTIKVTSLRVIPGECDGTLESVSEGYVEVEVFNDLEDPNVCLDLFLHFGITEAPVEIGTVQCDPDHPPQSLPQAGYGWTAWHTAHAYSGGLETGFQLWDWKCGSEDSYIVASKEYTLEFVQEEVVIIVEVRAEITYP